MAVSRRTRASCLIVLLVTWPALSFAAGPVPSARIGQLKVVQVREPDGQILSYRHLAGSIDVQMRGTRLAPGARIKLKIGSRPGFVELDINRGGITGLKPASRLGRDFLTYVLWAVSVDGKASNLGEITFEGGEPVPVNLTTPYQTFWLMVTAEPSYAVVDPSPKVVLYTANEGSASETKASLIRGDLFFFTHYSTYESTPGDAPDGVPNQLLQARKAMELAAKSTPLSSPSPERDGSKEAEYTQRALAQGQTFLARAEEAYKNDPKRHEVIQFARTAAQCAENARALSMGAVGGLLVRQMEDELVSLRNELAKRGATPAVVAADRREEPVRMAEKIVGESAQPAAVLALVKQPALWFALAGWGLAIVVLFRRRPV